MLRVFGLTFDTIDGVRLYTHSHMLENSTTTHYAYEHIWQSYHVACFCALNEIFIIDIETIYWKGKQSVCKVLRVRNAAYGNKRNGCVAGVPDTYSFLCKMCIVITLVYRKMFTQTNHLNYCVCPL